MLVLDGDKMQEEKSVLLCVCTPLGRPGQTVSGAWGLWVASHQNNSFSRPSEVSFFEKKLWKGRVRCLVKLKLVGWTTICSRNTAAPILAATARASDSPKNRDNSGELEKRDTKGGAMWRLCAVSLTRLRLGDAVLAHEDGLHRALQRVRQGRGEANCKLRRTHTG